MQTGKVWQRLTARCTVSPKCGKPVEVDVLAPAMKKDGAASEMPGDMQSPVIHREEQF